MKYALLLFYAAGTLAAPFLVLDDNLPTAEVKSVGCSASPFRHGASYAYDYAGETLSNIEGASKEWTGLKLKTRVFITSLSECKFSMQLRNSELSTKSRNQDFSRSDDSNKLQRELEKYELLFTMNGDKINTLVSHDMEQVDILNMKRGILSTLQVDKDAELETDVNGLCKPEVTMEGDKIVKTKKLSECYKRAQNIYGIQSASFKTESSLKPLNSNSKCTYTMDGETIKNVVCEESHLFRPFSAGYETPSGAMTIVKQTMKFVTGQNAPVSSVKVEKYNKESTLLFDHSEEETKSTNAMSSTVESIMSSLVNKDSLSAKQDSAHEFTALVMVLRKMNKKAMTPIWDKYFDCIKSGTCKSTETDLQGVYRQYLLDAIAYCGTSTCVSFVRDVIIDGEISGERVNMFLQSIALVGQTAKDMIKDVLEIARKQPSRQAFLSLGTLMYRHCSKTPKECEFEKRNPISEAEVFLERKLGEACEGQDNHERVEEILMALKSIGNARRPLRARGTLLKCAKMAKHSNITHSAFNAFQKMPCDGQFTDRLLNFIKNEDIDPEKRIHAFSAAMKCPSEYVLERLIKLLEDEPSKQVASFMWSHLTNTMESSDPTNKVAREILTRLTKITPLKVVDLGMHQYSRYFEKSLHSDKLKSGATAEGQIIYHPDGYFPRTGKMNVKATLLGESIDVFETLVHMEGLEDLLEDALGPDGVLPKDFLINIFNTTVTAKTLRDLAQQREERTRSKRGARMPGKINSIHEAVNMKPSKPTAHFNIKVMGQEVRVMSYDDLFYLIDQIDQSNVIQKLMDVGKGGQKTFTKSMMFMELTHVVPTAVGMPLKLKLTGTTVATIEMKGKFDIKNLFWGPGKMTIEGYVKPSAVVEVSGQMGVDTAYGSSGIFVNSTMFVSHLTKGNIIYTQGKLLKINVDTPEEPVQLFNVASSPYMYVNEKLDLIEGTERRINPDYCVKSKIIGYGLCTSARLPFAFREYEAPYFPLSGPAHFGIRLVRGDENLKTFQFQVKMEKKGKELIGDIEFSTPGAYYERRLSGKMRYSDVWGQKNLVFSTERNGKSAELQFNYNPNTKRSFVQAKTDLFTSKPIISKAEVFVTQNMVSEQYGMSYILTHDWYKFEHVTKFVKKDTGYMVHSATEYYKKNSVIGVLEYSTKDKKLTARLDANQLKQSFEVSGQLKTTNNGKGVTLEGSHLTTGKSASLYMGYVNTNDKKELIAEAVALKHTVKATMGYYNKNGLKSLEAFVSAKGKTVKVVASLSNEKTNKEVAMSIFWNDNEVATSNIALTNEKKEKSLMMSAQAAGKNAQSKIGYYKESNKDTIKAEVDILGRKAETFFTVVSSEGFKYTFGGIVGKYSAGLRGTYTNKNVNSVCLGVYYGTKDQEKQPGQACVTLKSLSNSYTHQRLSLTLECQKRGTIAEVIVEAKKQGEESLLTTAVKYMEKELAKETLTLIYRDPLNAEIKNVLTIGKYNGGISMFTKSSAGETQVAAHGFFMDKSITLMNKIKSATVGKGVERSLRTELIVNGKPLPVSTTLNLLSEKGSVGPSATLTLGKYAATYATMINYLPTEYSWLDEVVVTKESKSLLRYYRKVMLSLEKDQKELSYKFGMVVFEKTYEYGWETAYQNRGSASKSAHEVTLRLQYSTTRKSSVTFTLVNGKKTAELLVNVEYVPTKTLSHSISYNKNLRQLDISIEFLPKMHTKFMARLDKKNGYKFTTNFAVQWKKYKRSLKIVNKINNDKTSCEVSTSVGDNMKIGIVYKKISPRSLQINGRFMKHTVRIVTTLKKSVLRFNIIKNKNVLINVGVGLLRIGKSMRLIFLNEKEKVFALSGDYNRFNNALTISAKYGQKELISLSGRIDKSKRQISTTLKTSGKPLIKVIGKQSSKIISIKFAAPRMNRDITFAAELNKNKRSVTVSAESGNRKVGAEARVDLKNLITSLDFFCNKNTAGVQLAATDSAIVYTMTLTPEVSLRMTFEIRDDRVLRMSIERQSGKKFINEFSTQFKLSRKMSQIAVNWNTKYAKDVIAKIQPIVESYMKELKKVVKDLKQKSTTYVKKTAYQMKDAAFDFVDKVDEKFDSIDYIKIRDDVGKTALKGMKGMSTLVNTAIKKFIRVLKMIKRELPGVRKQLEKVTGHSMRFIRSVPGITAKNMNEIKSQLNKLTKIVMKVAKNLTESTRPVVMKAIELTKEFKLRGKTLEQIATILKIEGQKYMKMYSKLAKEQLKKMHVKLAKQFDKTKTYLLAMRIPYRKETVAEVIEILRVKIEEVKQMIAKIDAKELMKNARDYVMEYKVQGKPVNMHLDSLKNQLNELKVNAKNVPEKTRKLIHQLIKLIREYSRKAEQVYGEIVEFSKPMTKYVILVKNSAVKRFGPLYRDVVAEIEQRVSKLEMPSVTPYVTKQWKAVEEFVKPLVTPMGPLCKKLTGQVRDLNVMGFRVGTVLDMNIAMAHDMANSYAKKMSKMANKQIDDMSNYIEKYTKLTPEEMVDMVFESSAALRDNAVEYATKLYNQRDQMMKSAENDVKKMYKQLCEQIESLRTDVNQVMKKSPEELMTSIYRGTEQSFLTVAEELISISQQLSDFEVSKHTWTAWKEANVLGHLDKYGVNGKVNELIKAMKDVKFTKVIRDTVKAIRRMYDVAYSNAFVTTVQSYQRLENAIEITYGYIQSIPKKEYEQWYQELRQFTVTNKDRFVNFMTENFEVSKTKATQLYEAAEKLSKKSYNELHSSYVKPAMKVYKRVAKQSNLFYDDVKEPTIEVATHYKDIAVNFANKHYEIYRAIALEAVENIKSELESQYRRLKARVENVYEKFLSRYGDMTWEEVGESIVSLGEEKVALAKEMYKKQRKVVNKLVQKYKKQVDELVEKTKVQYNKYLARFNTEVKPKIMEKYQELKVQYQKLKTQYMQYRKKVEQFVEGYKTKALDMVDDVKERATSIYNNNKDKTLKVLYIEIRAMIVNIVNKHYKKATKIYNQKTKEAMKMTKEAMEMAKEYYRKVDHTMTKVILPEVAVELESIINQTLKNSVIMAEEIVKAYTPHFNLVKNNAVKYSEILSDKASFVYKKSKIEMKKQMAKLVELMKKLLKTVKNHKYTKQAVAQYKKALKHKYVIKAKATLEKIIRMTKEKMAVIRAHPTTKKYQKIIKEKVKELKELVKKYQGKLEKVMENKRYKKAMAVLKQLKKSAEHTLKKIVEIVLPVYTEMIEKPVTGLIKAMPTAAEEIFTAVRKDPAEAFWKLIREIKSLARGLYKAAEKIDREMIQKNLKEMRKIAKKTALETVDKIFDDWTKTSVKEAYKQAIEYSNKMQREAERLPGKLRKMARKAYKENMQMLKQWYKESMKTMLSQWKKCPFKAFVDNEIWRDIAQEISKHELTEAGVATADFTQRKLVEFTSMAVKEIKKQQKIIEAKLQELKAKALDRYEALKEEAIQKYNKLVARYNKLIEKANNFVETTTIADIVKTVGEKYEETLEKIVEAKEQAIVAKKRYVRSARAMYKDYKEKAVVQYKKLVAKMTVLYKKHVEPRVEKVRSMVMKCYNKHYPQVMAKYNELREQAEEKYEIYSRKAMEMYSKYKSEGKALFKKTKSQVIKKWMDSEIRAQLIELKGMSIRETIEALKRLPTRTRKYVMTQYRKYSNLVQVEFNKRYEQLRQELRFRREQIEQATAPSIRRVMRVYGWIENEIRETAVFIYRYHRVEERTLGMKNYITSEVRRMVPVLKRNIKKYAREYKALSQQLAYDYAVAAGDNTLRGIHSALRYLDTVDLDLGKYNDAVRGYFTELNKYIVIDVSNGEILINIPHREVTPKISHHIRKAGQRARRTVQDVKFQAQEMMNKVNKQLAKLKERAEELKEKLMRQVMENTVELRADMKTSFAVNKKIAQRVYSIAKLNGQKLYRTAMAKYNVWKQQAKTYLEQFKAFSKKQYNRFMTASRKAYLKASEIAADIYSVGPYQMHNRAFFHAKKYYTLAEKKLNRMYKTYRPKAVKMYRSWIVTANTEAKQLQRRAMPYYKAVAKAVKQVRDGASIKKAFKPIYHQLMFASRIYQRKLIKKVSEMKTKFCRKDPKLCSLIKNSVRIHEKLFEKYSIEVLELLATGKAHMHRAVRKLSKCSKRPFFGTSYRAAATIFGNHVLTFDKKYYDMIENSQAGCGYLLAHDFSNNKFTLKMEGDSFIVDTSDMSVTIGKDGKTSTKIGNKVINSLPVESKSGQCVRKDTLVICHFIEKNFKLVVDLKNDVTTFSISGWYYGKTQGILGTYNRESYDDWKLPNGKVTTNIYEFFNEYETSGKAKCQMKPVTKKPKACNQAPSAQCKDIFKKESSPYARHFSDVDPEPFWQSCIADTSACSKKSKKDSYCKSVAAYASFARASGKWIKFLPECMNFKGYEINSEFKQKALKNKMDVVVLVSQRQGQQKMRKNFNKFMRHLNAMLKNNKKQDIRYSVVGFGGQGIYERAHVQPLGDGFDVFGNINELIDELQSIPFNGEEETSNDAFHAILRASMLNFRPGASKVFVMFNSAPHTAHSEGPAYEEAKYALVKEAEATLIVFDKFDFKQINKRQGAVFGQSTRKLYTNKHWKKGLGRPMELPSSEYRELVEDTEGAMFQSKIKIPKHTAGSVFDVLKQHLTRHTKHCKVCRVTYTWTGAPKVICQTQEGLEC